MKEVENVFLAHHWGPAYRSSDQKGAVAFVVSAITDHPTHPPTLRF